jgi:hypothetical protein
VRGGGKEWSPWVKEEAGGNRMALLAGKVAILTGGCRLFVLILIVMFNAVILLGLPV